MEKHSKFNLQSGLSNASSLLRILPKSIVKNAAGSNEIEKLYNVIHRLHTHSKIDELSNFFREIGADQ